MDTSKKEQTQEDVVAFVEELYGRYKKFRQPYEQQWYVNKAYVMGKHYIKYSIQENRLWQYAVPTYRVQMVINLCRVIIRILTANLLRIEPTLYVMPGTDETKSVEAANIGFKFLTYLWRTVGMSAQLVRFIDRMCTYGTAFMMPFFNKNKGPMVEKDMTYTEDGPGRLPWIPKGQIKQAEDQDGNPLWIDVTENGEPKKVRVHVGQADVDILSPMEIYPCLEADDDPESLTSFIREKVRTIKWVDDIYGVKVEATTTYESNDITQQIASLTNENQNTKESNKDAVLVLDYFQAPNPKYPKGRIITICRGHKGTLQDTVLPPEYLKLSTPLPLIKGDLVPVSDRFWGAGILEDIIPLNTQLNKIQSKIIENTNMLSMGKWLIAEQTGVDEGSITTDAGQIIRYMAGSWPEPKQAALSQLPSYLLMLPETLQQYIYDVSGIHAVSHGKTPRGVRSGKAIQSLLEQDDTINGPAIICLGNCLEKLGICWLWIGKFRYVEPQLITVIGKNFRDYIENFKGSMLSDDAEVVCQMGSELPQTKSARQELYMQLYTLKAIEKSDLLKKLDVDQDVQPKSVLHKNKADAENEDMLHGQFRMPATFEDHMIHLEEHDMLRNQPIYRELDPKVKSMIDAHCEIHKKMLQMGAVMPEVQIQMQQRMMEMMPMAARASKAKPKSQEG